MYEVVRSEIIMMTARHWENILRNANEHYNSFIHCRTLKMVSDTIMELSLT